MTFFLAVAKGKFLLGEFGPVDGIQIGEDHLVFPVADVVKRDDIGIESSLADCLARVDPTVAECVKPSLDRAVFPCLAEAARNGEVDGKRGNPVDRFVIQKSKVILARVHHDGHLLHIIVANASL